MKNKRSDNQSGEKVQQLCVSGTDRFDPHVSLHVKDINSSSHVTAGIASVTHEHIFHGLNPSDVLQGEI